MNPEAVTSPRLAQLALEVFPNEADIRAMIELSAALGDARAVESILENIQEWIAAGYLEDDQIETLRNNFRDGIKNMVSQLVVKISTIEANHAESAERKAEIDALSTIF